jgi:hypothetical protein
MRKLLLIFTGLCLIAFGQELDSKQEELTQLEAEKTAVEEKLLYIAESPVRYSNERIAELDGWVKILPDRKPIKEGNITMKQYLQQLKTEVEKDPAEYVVKETEKLLTDKARIEAQIADLQEVER